MAKEVTGYYGPSEIMAVLSVSRTKALEIIHQFEHTGQLVKAGPKTLRVSVKAFDKWLEAKKVK